MDAHEDTKARSGARHVDYAKEPRSAWPRVVSKKEAKAAKKRSFFSGRACKYGHVCRRSAGNPVCPLCQRKERGRRTFVMQHLRGIRYPEKYEALENAYVKRARNLQTNRIAKLYRCAACEELFGAKEVAIDHIEPVVPVTGWDSWEAVIDRLFCEPEGFQGLCKAGCHAKKSKEENAARKRLSEKEM
jgi:hypothetical protein